VNEPRQPIARRRFLQLAAALGAIAPVSSPWGAAHAASLPDAYGSAAGLGPRGRLLIEIASDTIIPRTATAGALEAGVPLVIDTMLRDWATGAQRRRFLEGLAAFDEQIVARTGSPLDQLAPDARFRVLNEIDGSTFPLRAGELVPFFAALKMLTLAGYYTSEEGATEELSLGMMNGEYMPCDDVAGHRAESVLPSYRLGLLS
jgi:hypothetical protein